MALIYASDLKISNQHLVEMLRKVGEIMESQEKVKRKVSKDKVKKQMMYQSMALPGVIFMIIFTFIPIYGVLIAFKDFSIFRTVWDSPWVGFYHFERLFNDPMFWTVMRNTLGMNIIRIVVSFPLTIVVAIMINELTNLKFKKAVQTISYLPFFISWVILGGMMTSWLSEVGLVNTFLSDLSFISMPIPFLTNPNYYWAVAIISDIWRNMGWNTILYLAAMTTIDPTLYEAARIDGGSKLQQIVYITLPGIRNIIALTLVLTVSGLLGSNLDQTLVLQNPVNFQASEVLGSFVFRLGILGGHFSFATAVGIFVSVVSFILVIGSNILSKKIGDADVF